VERSNEVHEEEPTGNDGYDATDTEEKEASHAT
jgi:hypothetical protein